METHENNQYKKERTYPTSLDLSDQSTLNTTKPVLVIQSPKTPTLSRKLKAVSLDSDPPKQATTSDLSRDVFSVPNTPKKQIKHKLSEFDESNQLRMTLAPISSNLKKFASNNSISGSQTLKTLPEIMTLQDFSNENRSEPIRIKAKGLLERRGSNASLTIDLGSNTNISEPIKQSFPRLNTAKSVSNLNLSTFGVSEQCNCIKKTEVLLKCVERRKSQETCGNCIIYESVPSKINLCRIKCQKLNQKCSCIKSRRKSLSNENLYVPPCGFCQTGSFKNCSGSSKNCKGYRKAYYPRQPDLESSQLLSEDFKLHLQNIQYLQTAGNVLSIADLKQSCEVSRVPKLHQEFWEVPLNLQEKCYVSGSQNKNRYRGVLPNEHSRVHLPGSQNYIHANYIKGPDYTETAYIATQGPMSHTCQDFWEMMWFTNCICIVMLTGLIEKGRSKCELYFPLGKNPLNKEKTYYFVKSTKARDKFTFDSKNMNAFEEEIVQFEELNEVTFGNFKITFVKKEYLGECVIRHLELRKTDKMDEVRRICHYWYSNWPDHKMANPDTVLKIALHVLNIQKTSKRYDFTPIHGNTERKKSIEITHQPIIVHCSAGIGRTGCFLAILNGIQQLTMNLNVDVLAILCSLRLNRGGMVQTAEQYELIHRVLSIYTENVLKCIDKWRPMIKTNTLF